MSFRDKQINQFDCLHLLNIKSSSHPILWEVTTESQLTTLESFELSSASGNMQSPQSSAVF